MNGGDQKRPAGRIALWALSDRYALRLTLGRGALGAQTLSLALWDGDTGRAVRIAGAARPFGDSKPPALPQGTDALRIQAGNCAALLERTGGALRIVCRGAESRGGLPLMADLRLFQIDGPPWNAAGCGLRGPLPVAGRAEWGEGEYLFAPAHSFGIVERIPPGLGPAPGRRMLAAGLSAGEQVCLAASEGPFGSVLLRAGLVTPLPPPRWEEPGPEETAADARLTWTCGEATLTPLARLETGKTRRTREIWVFGRLNGHLTLPGNRHVILRQTAAVWRETGGRKQEAEGRR